MDKLIVVGMRHITPNVALRNLRVGDSLDLCLENNSNGIDGKAYLVNRGMDRLGYIRNQDLPGLFKYANKVAYIPRHYVVEAIRTNYVLLKRDPSSKSYSIDNYKQDRNPCNEIDIDENVFYRGNASSNSVPKDNFAKKESKEMLNTNSMRNQFFREVKNVASDIQTGNFGMLNSDGISVFDKGVVNVNPIQELGVKVPAFAMRVAVDQLKAGDIIINGEDASFFVEAVKDGGYKVISTSGEMSTVGNVKNMFFGANTVLAVKNMFEGSGMNPMMMALMMGDGKMDMKNIALMSMMGGQGGMDSNMLMMMMLMGDK